MHDILRERLLRNLEALPEERLYQVLDYIEFLNSKYARDSRRSPSAFQKFGERLEDSMRMNRVGYSAIRGTMEVVGTAEKVVTDIADVGRSILKEVGAGLRPLTEPAPSPEVPRLGKGDAP